jgi:hypothetical protein
VARACGNAGTDAVSLADSGHAPQECSAHLDEYDGLARLGGLHSWLPDGHGRLMKQLLRGLAGLGPPGGEAGEQTHAPIQIVFPLCSVCPEHRTWPSSPPFLLAASPKRFRRGLGSI